MMRLENWGGSAAYERYMGRWSRLVAHRYLRDLSMPKGLTWLDVGCGTGALTEAVATTCDPRLIIGIDLSEGFARTIGHDSADRPIRAAVAGAVVLPFEAGAVDIAVSGLALNFMPRSDEVVREWRRVVKADGVVSAYVWDYADRMEFIRSFWDAAMAIDPAAAALDEGERFPLCNPDALTSLFERAGLRDVHVWPVEITTEFADFEDFWTPFLAGQGPAPTYVASLSGEARAALREAVRRRLGGDGSDPIRLVARAWAARGTNPGAFSE